MARSVAGHPRILPSLVLIVLLLGGGTGVAGILYVLRRETPRRETGALPPVVKSLTLGRETVTERFVGYGTAQPYRVANLAAEVTGRVVELVDHLRAGTTVTSGTPLIRLDDREYQETLKRAAALAVGDQAGIDEVNAQAQQLRELIATAQQETRVARDEWLRVGDLYERNLAAKKEVDFANLAYAQSRRVLQGYQMEASGMEPRIRRLQASMDAHNAQVNQAKLLIERCEIKAPFDGAVKTLMVEVGNWVGPGAILLTLIDPLRIEIPIQLPASVYDRVRVGDFCRVTSESLRDVDWKGEVTRIAPSVDERTRTFAAYVEVDNTVQLQACIPGTFVVAQITGPVHVDVLVIPRSAVRDGRVLVVQDGTAVARSVKLECLVADRAIVSGELVEGDVLILSRLGLLEVGSPVRVRPAIETTVDRMTTPGQDLPGASP